MTTAARMVSGARTLTGFRPAAGLCLILAHGLLSPGLALAAGPTAAFIACGAEKDDAKRLACFDAAVSQARAQPAAPAEAAAVTAAPALTKEEKFGLRGDLKEEKAKKAPELVELQSMTGKVTKLAAKPHGELIVTLDNGQVWYEIQANTGLRVKVGDQVTIKAGALGSYSLVANGRSSKVTRVR
jgi:hypothetical protein